MISFQSDYNNGIHPEILKRLEDTNLEILPGYGLDKYTCIAREKICKFINMPNLDIEFLVGGTQTNAIVISTMLRDYEGVIAAKTGHISLHEAGAIEYTGHKVIEIDSHDGKLEALDLKKYLEEFYGDENHSHMVYPGMVYISFPTEYGTIYSKNELKNLSSVCHEYNIPLFIDGARLGYGLMSLESDVTIQDIANYSDVFYIGGTKVGAICGEAVVFTKNNKPKNFITSVKKRGALLAKGRLLGVQFDALFTDNLYFRISEYVIQKANKLKDIFKKYNMEFYLESPTNQQFIIVTDQMYQKIKEKVAIEFWSRIDEKKLVIRFVTGWRTTDKDLEELERILKDL